MYLVTQFAQRVRCCLLIIPSLLLVAGPLCAQPSGGPYGPVDQRYEVPTTGHVYFVAPDGKPEASGATIEQPTTLGSAIEKVVTGDTIVMRGGIYRTGGHRYNQGITIQPYLNERPVLKGTLVPEKWEPVRGGAWRTKWDQFFPAKPLAWWSRRGQGTQTPLHRFNNDMVFVDGEMLRSMGWEGELDEHSYYIDYDDGYVYIGVNPADKLVEITAFDGALVRTSKPVHGKENDHKGPVLRGLTFTQYAYRALEVEGKKTFTSADEPTDEPVGLSDPSTFGKEAIGTVLENLTITFCSRVGGYFRGDGLIIRNCLVSDTSTEGIYVIGSSDVLLERNIVRRNNIEGLTGYYPSAVKIFNQTRRVTVRDNLILDNADSSGVWYDVGNRDGVFINNYVEGATNGFFFEISRGVTVVGNVFSHCGNGVLVLNSADAHVYNNTFLDAPVSFRRDPRSATGDTFAWHPSTGPDVDEREGHVFVNNLLVASDSLDRPLLQFGQPPMLCNRLTRPMAKEIAGNVYARAKMPGKDAAPLVAWSPAANADNCSVTFGTLDEFRAAAQGFEAGGQEIDRTPGSIFKGPDFSRYDLIQSLPGTADRTVLPDDVRELLGWSVEEARSPGAYPFGR